MTGAVAAFLQAKRMPTHGSERIFSGRRDLFFAAFAVQDLDVTARPMQLQESQDGAARLVFEVYVSKCCVITVTASRTSRIWTCRRSRLVPQRSDGAKTGVSKLEESQGSCREYCNRSK